MKSYGQLCAVARALDVVGDRWTMLIVRELLIRGSARFSEIERGLPGVAPNLLSGRLRDLEANGVIERDAGDGASTQATRYSLTSRGRDLSGVVRELLKWGAALVPAAPDDAAFQMHWFSMPAAALLADGRPEAPAQRVRFGTLDDGFDAVAGGGSVSVTPPAPAEVPDAVVTGPGKALVALVQGVVTPDQAAAMGVAVDGDPGAVMRLMPQRG